LCRYSLAGIVQQSLGATFPWGTLAVNVTGCFAAGALVVLFEDRLQISGEMRAVILIGFMGAFTTFSTFVVETGQLMRDAEWLFAAGNVVLQNAVGMLALFSGMAVARFL
jgi:CrcB protein